MKITIVASFFTIRDMDIDSCHQQCVFRCRFVPVRSSILFRLLVFFVLVFGTNHLNGQSHHVQWNTIDTKPELLSQWVSLPDSFPTVDRCSTFVLNELLPMLYQQGFLSASVDSLWTSSSHTRVWLFVGDQFRWGQLYWDSTLSLMDTAQWKKNNFKSGALLDPADLVRLRAQLLEFLEDNGYPFASVRFKNGFMKNGELHAQMEAERGPFYRIDSIHVEGNLRVTSNFLQQFLNIHHGEGYSKAKLNQVSTRLASLDFVREFRPWDMHLMATGSALNLYLESQKSSRFNFLAGLMPSNEQIGGKLLLTGEAEMDLRNSFGGGERLYFNWQQLQVRSPRIQLAFDKPYVFKSKAGIDFQFNLLRKDSSFITIQARGGIRYDINGRQSARVFLQQFSSRLLNPDTLLIRTSLKLPTYLDVSTTQIGFGYRSSTTNDAFNPRRGMEWDLQGSIGLRKLIRNAQILQIKQNAFGQSFDFARLYDTVPESGTQFRFQLKANNYLPIGTSSTVRIGVQAALVGGKQLLINELYQIGGFRTLRGFDEERIFSKAYAIGTLEYRYLTGRSSYLYGFTDLGIISRRAQYTDRAGVYAGLGVGVVIETKSGMFNLAYAVGKSPDQSIDLRQSKIHFGFVGLF